MAQATICCEESANTLKFATRAKRMVIHAGVNEVRHA